MDERKGNEINFIVEDDKIDYDINELHTQINIDKIPYLSCFELSTMLSGKWITTMFDKPEKSSSLTIIAKNKFTILANDNLKAFLQKLHSNLINKAKEVKYKQINDGKVSSIVIINIYNGI